MEGYASLSLTATTSKKRYTQTHRARTRSDNVSSSIPLANLLMLTARPLEIHTESMAPCRVILFRVDPIDVFFALPHELEREPKTRRTDTDLRDAIGILPCNHRTSQASPTHIWTERYLSRNRHGCLRAFRRSHEGAQAAQRSACRQSPTEDRSRTRCLSCSDAGSDQSAQRACRVSLITT